MGWGIYMTVFPLAVQVQVQICNPFDPPQPLDANPFDASSGAHPQNPFTSQANDSTFSLDSQDTARGLGRSNTTRSGATQQELEARERDLRAREEALAANEARLSGVQVNNWPPFFPFCHHDISSLPSQHQQVTKFLYFQWLALIVTLVVNLVGCILLLVAGSSQGGADTGAAGGYLLFISVLSFVLWYRPIYLGFTRSEGRAMAFFFYIYFLFAGFHLLFSIYMVIGIPSAGSAGLINTIAMFSQGHIVAGIFGLFSSIGWVLQSAGGGILYKRVWDYKNGHGDITFQAATDQMKAASIKNIILHQSRV